MKKAITPIIAFILLVPFRLPISVIMIKVFNYLAQLEGTPLNHEILLPNIMLTKILYNITMSSLIIYGVEKAFRKQSKGVYKYKSAYRNEIKTQDLHPWSIVVCVSLILYACFDAYSTYQLYNSLFNI